MSLFTENILSKSALEAITENTPRGMEKTASRVLFEYAESMERITHYDFFICHAKIDETMILGLIQIMKKKGFNCYVDWINDPRLSRLQVTPETARLLKKRIRESTCLLYAFTEGSTHSKWMPWELGIKDGHNGKVLICPITKQVKDGFADQEYLGLYPYLTVHGYSLLPDLKYLEVNNLDKSTRSLVDWMK